MNAADTKRLRVEERSLTEIDRLIHATYEDRVMSRVPENMCIFLLIALNDGIDTLNSDSANMDMMPIRNVVSVPNGQNPK